MIEAYKKKYQTCLEMLEELRLSNPELRDQVLSYNGILDPMAEGIVPVLVGSEENKNRDRFTGSIKEYQVAVLVGVSTDSSDLLGIVREMVEDSNNVILNLELVEMVKDLEVNKKILRKAQNDAEVVSSDNIISSFCQYPREFEQTVPMHSNRKVRGKRLWWWALHGELIDESERPKNKVKILEIEFLNESSLSAIQLKSEIDMMGRNIGERFRLTKVLESWNNFFVNNNEIEFKVLNFQIMVTSGFYVRTFVESVSEELDLPLVVFSLARTKVIPK